MGFRKDNNLEPIMKSEKSEAQKVDRVILDASSIAILQNMLNQANSKLGDLVQISQKDLVNFLIQKRSPELSHSEIRLLREENFDMVRALKRAVQEVTRARQAGQDLQIDDVLKLIQTPIVNENRPLKKLRGRKTKANSSRGASEKEESFSVTAGTARSLNSEEVKNLNFEGEFKDSGKFSQRNSS